MTPAALLLLATGFALQPPGSFHAGEPVARDGESWLALVRGPGDAAALAPARLRVSRVVDELVDGPGEATGVEIAAPGLPEALAFLRGPGLHAGPVESAVLQPDATSGPGFGTLVFHGSRYRLALRCPSDAPGPAPQACTVVLAHGATVQPLFAITRVMTDGVAMLGDDASPTLLFAGDLDRDGRLDLLLDTTDHYNLARPTLLLSSQARAGELVGQAAVHESVGC